MGKKKKDRKHGTGAGLKKKCCDKPLRKMCKRCPRRACGDAVSRSGD